MQTIFISGNDTGIGKTWVTASIARMLAKRQQRIQLVKPVETGIKEGQLGDIEQALSGLSKEFVSGYCFYQFEEPIAPLDAAEHVGEELRLDALCSRVHALPESDWRIVEGAGGLAVPIDLEGHDWADFAQAIAADFIVLVVDNRLGAINQARLLAHYGLSRGLNAGLWLNEVSPQSEAVKASNIRALKSLEVPLWATHTYGEMDPQVFGSITLPIFNLQEV